MKSLLIFLIVIIFSTASYSQYKNERVLLPAGEKVTEAFKVPGGYWFAGIQLNTDLSTNQDSCFFLVTSDPKLGYDTLKYEGETYWIAFEQDNEAISLNVSITFPWPWFKIVFDQAYQAEADYYFYSQFIKP